jgi:outer membrane biosynthesis protein TonB
MSVRTDRKLEHRRIALAVAVSLLIHVLILLTAVLLLSLNRGPAKKPAPAPAPPPMKLTILPAPLPKPPEQKKQFFDSSQGTLSEKTPEKPVFESDRNTAAASQLPPKSDLPVPTTNGEDIAELTLTARNLSLGPTQQPSQPSPASPPKPQAPAKPETKPEPTPAETPEPTPPPEKPLPTPKPTPKPTPRPEDTELAMLDPSQPKPKPKPPAEKPQPKPVEQMPPSKPQPPGYQPQTRVTRLVGGISSKGKLSIGSEATPLGRYKKQISDAIGSRWYYYVSDMIDLVNVGTVQLTFVVQKNGKVTNVRVVRNTSNESLASCSVRSIIEAEIPPMPKDVAGVVAGERIEVDFTFAVIR